MGRNPQRAEHGLREQTRNPNKCAHNPRAISIKIEIITTTINDTTKMIRDTWLGRRPELESDEFLVVSCMVVEIWGRHFQTFPKNVYTYWDFRSILTLTFSIRVVRPFMHQVADQKHNINLFTNKPIQFYWVWDPHSSLSRTKTTLQQPA